MLLARKYSHPTKAEMCNYLNFHKDMEDTMLLQAGCCDDVANGNTANIGSRHKKVGSYAMCDVTLLYRLSKDN